MTAPPDHVDVQPDASPDLPHGAPDIGYDPYSIDPDGIDPGSYVDPGAFDPGVLHGFDPGALDPSGFDPGVIDPGYADHGDPGYDDPGYEDPGYELPDDADPGHDPPDDGSQDPPDLTGHGSQDLPDPLADLDARMNARPVQEPPATPSGGEDPRRPGHGRDHVRPASTGHRSAGGGGGGGGGHGAYGPQPGAGGDPHLDGSPSPDGGAPAGGPDPRVEMANAVAAVGGPTLDPTQYSQDELGGMLLDLSGQYADAEVEMDDDGATPVQAADDDGPAVDLDADFAEVADHAGAQLDFGIPAGAFPTEKEMLADQLERIGGQCVDPTKFTEAELRARVDAQTKANLLKEPAGPAARASTPSEREAAKEQAAARDRAEYRAAHPNYYDAVRGQADVLAHALSPLGQDSLAGALEGLFELAGDDPATAAQKAALLSSAMQVIAMGAAPLESGAHPDTTEPARIGAEHPAPAAAAPERPAETGPKPAAAEHASPRTPGPIAPWDQGWTGLIEKAEAPQVSREDHGYRFQQARDGDRAVFVLEGHVTGALPQAERISQYGERLPGEDATHAGGMQIGDNWYNAFSSAPAGLNRGDLKVFENALRQTADAIDAAGLHASVETTTTVLVEYRHGVPVMVGIERTAEIRGPGGVSVPVLDYAARIDPDTRAVTTVRPVSGAAVR